MDFSNNQPTPDQLAQAAANKFAGTLAQQQCEEVNESYGTLAEYIKLPAANKVQRQMESGKIRTPQQFTTAYKQAMVEEAETFKTTFRPGYQRDAYNPQIPADAEVRDYIAERRRQTQEMKDKGAFLNEGLNKYNALLNR